MVAERKVVKNRAQLTPSQFLLVSSRSSETNSSPTLFRPYVLRNVLIGNQVGPALATFRILDA
jgi:hypothetical protein